MKDNTCNKKDFSKIYDSYAPELYKVLRYKYGDKLELRDIVQDAFIKLWNNCSKVPLQKAKGYVFTISNNMVLNKVKHEKVRLNFKNKHNPKLSTNESPEFLLEEKEYLMKYQNALSNLTESQRVAFLLNRVDGKSYDEIAEMLSITKKAVQKRVYGALMKLKKDIEGIK